MESVWRCEKGLVRQHQIPPEVPRAKERATLHWEHGRPVPIIPRGGRPAAGA